MTMQARTVVSSSSVALFAIVNLTAALLASADATPWLMLCAALAIAAAMQSAAWEPADLLAAITLSLLPLVGLVSDGGSVALVGVLGVLLLCAAELNVLSWEMEGAGPVGAGLRRRLVSLVQLAFLGVLAVLGVLVIARLPFVSGMAAVVVAAGAVMVLGRVVFLRAV
jgi:hypothetical protein